jgi:hypothetical protein
MNKRVGTLLRSKPTQDAKTAAPRLHYVFRERLPYKVIPTNIDGVYASQLPDKIDPNTATAGELIKNGLLLRRPGKDQHPALTAAWQKFFSRQWLAKDHIVPYLQPQPGKTHFQRRFFKKTENAFTSNNWSGASIQGNWVTCFGNWIIPTVSQPAEPQGQEGFWNSASWVGIDGVLNYGSNDVLQAGVQQLVNLNGQASYVAWFEWFVPAQVGGAIDEFSSQKVILGDTGPLSPSVASFSGNLYLAWKGDGNDNLNVMVSTDNGRSFGGKMTSPETSDDVLALAADTEHLYIGWKGSGNDNLNVAIVDIDPQTGFPLGISNKTTVGDTSPFGPALATFNGALYMAWKGDGNDNLSVMVSTDNGQTFGNKVVSPETSDCAPALAENNGSLFIAWKGSGNDNLNVAVVDTDLSTGIPSGLSNKVTLGDTSPTSPTLGALNGYLFLGWKGDGNDNLNLMFSSDNGQNFGGKLTSPETSDTALAVTVNNGSLFIAWKGSGNDNLNVSLVGLTGFTVPPYVNQTNIPNFPVNPGDSIWCSVQYVNNQTAGLIYFANWTTGQSFSVTLVPPPGASFNGDSAEWIMEAPDGGLPISSLPSFTPVQFADAFACTANQTTGDPKNGDTWNIVNGVNQTLTSVGVGSGTVTIDFIG